jgi:tetratricopeptide (TPR) repeat protein
MALPFAAAAIVIGIVFGVFMWMKPVSTEQLAEQYMRNNLQTLGVTMGSKEDSLQAGLRLYNESKYAEALIQFESIIQSDSSKFTALEYAGITALQLKEYDKALYWFIQLENQPGLFSNPGKFYHALTLMKRNLPGDNDKSYQLLNDVVTNNLAGRMKQKNG